MTHAKLISRSLLFASVAAFIACSVDTDKFAFDDDQFAKERSGDGDGDGSGGGAMGGSTGSGGGSTLMTTECGVPGTLSCDGNQVVVCSGDQSVPVGGECEFLCADGNCAGSCHPDEKECLSNVEQRVCTSSGDWDATRTCSNQACVDGECVGECTPGTLGCDDTNKLRCSETGTWEDNGSCSAGTCMEGACTSCNDPSQTQCKADSITPQTCDGSNWVDGTVCEHLCIDGSCGGVCRPALSGSPAEKSCSGNRLQTCNANAQWQTSQTCPFVCKDSGDGSANCTGVCKPGATECQGSTLRVCSADGVWKAETDCSEKNLLCIPINEKPEFGCGECTFKEEPKVTRCSQIDIQVCTEEARWETAKNCENGCYSSACLPGDQSERNKFCKNNQAATGCMKENAGWDCRPDVKDPNTFIWTEYECAEKSVCETNFCEPSPE